METKTLTLIVSAPKDRVFNYLADIKNLPRWATEFCQKLENKNGTYKVCTCQGDELYFEVHADKKTGVIDYWAGPASDKMGVFPTRVIELPGAMTAYLFTMFQMPGVNPERFEGEYESLKREFKNLEKEFSA